MRFFKSKDSVCFSGQVTEHKFWEIEGREDHHLDCNFSFRFNTKGDHAGLHIGGAFLFWSFDVKVYDHRHWDYERDTWVKHE